MHRRSILRNLAGFSGAIMFGPSIRAATFPSKPIKLLNGFPAGGATEVLVRVVAKAAEEILGVPIIVENRPGAGSTISLIAAKNSPPDGYTIAFSSTAAFSTPVQVETSYDPIRDSTYIVRLGNIPFGIMTRADSPFRTWQSLLKHLQDNPGKESYGFPGGPGTTGHLGFAEVIQKEKLGVVAVPFKGSSDLQQALLGGHITFAADALASVASGGSRQNILAVLTRKRLPLWPSVPTLAELGYDVAFDSPWGIVGPPGMDASVVKVLHDAFKKAFEERSVRARIIAAGSGDLYAGPAEYTKYARDEYELQWRLLEKHGLARKR